MTEHALVQVIRRELEALNAHDFEALMEFYSDEAVLVSAPGLFTRGKAEIRKAFEGIAAYFDNTLVMSGDKISIIEAGDTALASVRGQVKARLNGNQDFSTERSSTYVFRREAGVWRCVIDYSGADLKEQNGKKTLEPF